MGHEHFIDLNDYSRQRWDEMIQLAHNMKQDEQSYGDACGHKIMGTLFFEPSTRTQMSFQTAMLKLGGQYLGFHDPNLSSMAKGESFTDTIRVISSYVDILTIRHPHEGAAKLAALYANCPVINAGDGAHLHPTQTLTDLVTLKYQKGRCQKLTIGICGDLKNARVVHSLIKALAIYPENFFVLISTHELKIPTYLKKWLNSHHSSYVETTSMTEYMNQLDVLYMTRIQQERFVSQQQYGEQKDVYILSPFKLALAKEDLSIMHPLPRLDEIDQSIDEDPRATYFEQAKWGVYARMALISTLLAQESSPMRLKGKDLPRPCHNPMCITNQQPNIKKSYIESDDIIVCEYCDK